MATFTILLPYTTITLKHRIGSLNSLFLPSSARLGQLVAIFPFIVLALGSDTCDMNDLPFKAVFRSIVGTFRASVMVRLLHLPGSP